jgi:hypothetical protein
MKKTNEDNGCSLVATLPYRYVWVKNEVCANAKHCHWGRRGVRKNSGITREYVSQASRGKMKRKWKRDVRCRIFDSTGITEKT